MEDHPRPLDGSRIVSMGLVQAAEPERRLNELRSINIYLTGLIAVATHPQMLRQLGAVARDLRQVAPRLEPSDEDGCSPVTLADTDVQLQRASTRLRLIDVTFVGGGPNASPWAIAGVL